MNCKTANNNFLKYLDNELESLTRIEFEAHLSACKGCATQLNKIRSIYMQIDLEKEEFAQNHFLATKIWNKIQTETEENVPMLAIRRSAIAYLAVAGVFLGILIGTIFNKVIINNDSTNTEQTWSQLADDYFPSDYYEPLDDINDNAK